MNALRINRGAALSLVTLALAPQAIGQGLVLPRDGWASWAVPAVENAPDSCCFTHWSDRSASRRTCELDDSRDGYGSRDGATTDSIRVYVRFADGKIERLRALSATCPVQSDTEIRDLGSMSADESARWLTDLALKRGVDSNVDERIADHALAALAVHRGTVAHEALAGIARSGPNEEGRKHAVFWLAHVRGIEGAKVATSIMFSDPDADMREHAAFAVSQSIAPQADQDLIRLATGDEAASVRSHAWFSLAMTKSAKTEEAIEAALRRETDARVREHAIFALSQLPDNRATHALIKVAEDKSLGRGERKRAVFWLSQSESSAAQAYLERILAKAPE